MHLTRRHFLSGTCAVLAARSVPAFAQDPVTAALVISAAANVVVKVLEFQKQSGDISLEFAALNLKLDQVLRNQVLILQAISDLDDDIKTLLRNVGRVPAEVRVLDQLIQSGALCSQLADSLSRGRLEDVPQLSKRAYELSTQISKAAALSDRPPNLSLAARNILNVTQTIKTAMPTLQNELRGTLSDTCTYVRDALERMIAANGIPSRINEIQTSLNKAVGGLNNANLKLLPADFSSNAPRNVGAETVVVSTCLLSPGPERLLASHSICRTYGPPGDRFQLCETATQDFELQTNVTKAKFQIQRQTAYGGRQWYNVTELPQNQWDRTTWNRRVSRGKQGGPIRNCPPTIRLG